MIQRTLRSITWAREGHGAQQEEEKVNQHGIIETSEETQYDRGNTKQHNKGRPRT
jgi:hypothetical protein